MSAARRFTAASPVMACMPCCSVDCEIRVHCATHRCVLRQAPGFRSGATRPMPQVFPGRISGRGTRRKDFNVGGIAVSILGITLACRRSGSD
jgi:hypothetical protein